MSVFKEINKADGSGVTQFFRLSTEKQTVETNDYGDFYNFKGGVASRKDLPTTKLETGDAYFIEDEEKTVFWDGTAWREINAYVLNYNYNDASNKPLINGHVLSGDKSAAELELQPAGDYLTEIPEEYITEKELEDLDLADKNYVIDQINNIEHFHREIVDGLPVIGKDNVIYMIKKKSASGDDIYDEWMWVDTKYEHIGSTAADLSDYYKKGETDKLLDKKVDKVTGKGLSTNDYTTAEKTKLASLENYDDTQIKADLAALHNYDDTDIKNDITALKTAENGLKTDVSDIKEELKDKIEGVRLVRSGDMWDFYTVGGTRLTYESARELLGHPNTILYMEGVENDGKTTPADYDIDKELIHVHYMDEMGEDRYLQMGYPNTASAEGSYIHIEDAVAQPLNSLTIDGKTEQKTTAGKNLFNYKDKNDVDELYAIDNDGWITITYDNSKGTTNKFFNYYTHNLDLKTSTQYNGITEIKKVTGTGRLLSVSTFGPEGQSTTTAKYDFTSLSSNSLKSFIFTTRDEFTGNLKGIRTFVAFLPGQSGSVTFRLSVLEDITVTPQTFIYEPYTGGQPSPSPDYPSEIENVKGKNLFKPTLATTVINGITCIANKDGTCTLNGTATADAYFIIGNDRNLTVGKTYKFVGCPNGGSNTTYRMGWNYHGYEYRDGLISKKTTEARNVQITIFKGVTVSNLIFKPMFTENTLSTYNDYVPYGNIQIVETGENLLDNKNPNYIVGATWQPTKTGVKISASAWNWVGWDLKLNMNEQYTFSYGAHNSKNIYLYIRTYTDATYTTIKTRIVTDGINLQNTFKPDSEYVRIVFANNAVIEDIEIPNIQLEKGPTATNYEPYTEEVVNIDLKGNELCSLPNGTKDELVIENNRVKINKKIGKIILDGSEDWSSYTHISGTILYRIYLKPMKLDDSNIIVISNYARAVANNDWIANRTDNIVFGGDDDKLQFIIPNITTLADFKSWLKANPVTVYYELNEPEIITLSEIDMPTTFEGVNNITIDSNLSPNIKINYITNVNYLDKNIGFKNHYVGYYEDAANLPTGNKGDIATVSSDKRIYINDGNEWVPSDKNSTIDLSNYLAKDNTTGYAPTGNYNPATKKYVDDGIKGINIPTKTSQLTNDSNFVVKTTNELTNYYTKNNTYTKTEVNALVAGGGGGSNVSITVNGDTLVITTK